MGSVCCRYQEPDHFEEDNSYIRVLCKKSSWDLLQSKTEDYTHAQIIKLNLYHVNAGDVKKSFKYVKKQSQRSISISSELQNNKLLVPDTLQTYIWQSIVQMIRNTAQTNWPPIIIIQQPKCSSKVDMASIFKRVIKSILLADKYMVQYRNGSQYSSEIQQDMHQDKAKARVYVYWNRIREIRINHIINQIKEQTKNVQ